MRIITAIQIADHYRHRLPTPMELIERYGMSTATAYRWVAAFKRARRIR